MKTIFDAQTVAGLVKRIDLLKAEQPAEWGKMDVYQMLKHCTMSEEMFLGRKQYKRLFIGRLFGGFALKGILKNQDPMKKNQPTHPEMKITGTGDFSAERDKWIQLLKGYASFSNPEFVHPFFGKMSTDEIGKYIYKHCDHHLRQFRA
jgi:hypothetical protein